MTNNPMRDSGADLGEVYQFLFKISVSKMLKITFLKMLVILTSKLKIRSWDF